MADVSIAIDGDKVIRRLNATPRQINIANRQAMEDSMVLLLRDQRTYPRPPANTTYKRTLALQKSWSYEIKQGVDTIRGRVGSNPNTAPYNRYVQDEAMQARVHAQRWTNTIQGTLRARQTTIEGFFEERLRRAVAGA